MSSYLSSRTSNYYKSLLQKNFTSYQVLEVFMFVFVGGLLIYAGMEVHKSEDLIKSLCSCITEDDIKKELSKIQFPISPTSAEITTFMMTTLPIAILDGMLNLQKNKKPTDTPSNNTLGWLLILMGVGTILLGLYRLFMKGTVAE